MIFDKGNGPFRDCDPDESHLYRRKDKAAEIVPALMPPGDVELKKAPTEQPLVSRANFRCGPVPSVSLGYEAIDTSSANPSPAKASPVRSATSARTPRLGDQGTKKMGSPIRNGIGARLPIVPLTSRLIPNPPPVHPLIPQ